MKNSGYILLCEDSEDVRLITAYTLELEGFAVDTAKNTDEIFSKLDKKKPFLILLDFNIPEAGGAAVIEQLKKRIDTKSIPVVLFSGEEKLSEIAATLKADGFLRKPLDVNELKIIAQKFATL